MLINNLYFTWGNGVLLEMEFDSPAVPFNLGTGSV